MTSISPLQLWCQRSLDDARNGVIAVLYFEVHVRRMEDATPSDTGADAQGVVDESSAPPVYQSRLRAKREERMQQRYHPAAGHPESDDSSDPAFSTSEAPLGDASVRHGGRLSTSRSTSRSTSDEQRRRQRAEARRLLIAYPGTVWDAVQANDLAMLRNFFLVEGTAKLVRAHCKSPGEFGRTLLHSAAWWGRLEVVGFLLNHGASVNAIDTAATRLTPLMDAARAGHADVGELLLQHGADATLCDCSGDNAFHWAGRRARGPMLLRLSLLLDSIDHSAFVETWMAKNVRGQTPADYVRLHPTVFSMIVKRLGERGVLLQRSEMRRARFTAGNGSSSSSPAELTVVPGAVADLEETSSRPSTIGVTSRLSGVDALGIDVSSFAYKSRDSIPSH